MAGTCECGSEASGSIKCREILQACLSVFHRNQYLMDIVQN